MQPKTLVRDEAASASLSRADHRLSQSHRGATHIVKFWEQNEYPQLTANEYFCLRAAQLCPQYRLSEDALALVIDRFDLRPDGTYRGFEDFCLLNARRTDQKYSMKRFAEFSNSSHVGEDLERLFTLIVIHCALRKWGCAFEEFRHYLLRTRRSEVRPPVYDLVTAYVYLPKESMALTLNGTTKWPSGKELQLLGEIRMGGSAARVREMLERVRDAAARTAGDIKSYIKNHPEFDEIGSRMMLEWQKGSDISLRGLTPLLFPAAATS